MKSWTFRFELRGVDVGDDEQSDALFEAGCDDGSFGEDVNGDVEVVFHREAPSPEFAVVSAIRSVESVPGARVTRVHTEDEWLSATELAERLGRSKQSVHQLIKGQRGPGDFPAPASPAIRRHHALWSWEDVRAWFAIYDPTSVPATPPYPSADFLAAVNDRLDLRERGLRVPDAPWWGELDAAVPLPRAS